MVVSSPRRKIGTWKLSYKYDPKYFVSCDHKQLSCYTLCLYYLAFCALNIVREVVSITVFCDSTLHWFTCIFCNSFCLLNFQNFGLEYERYLKEVVNVLETDPVFKKKLEESNVSDIKVTLVSLVHVCISLISCLIKLLTT